MQEALPPDRETQARELADASAQTTQEELLQIARTLVGTEPATLFGQTEFKVRDLAHRIAAKAFERHLASKKTATTPPP